MCSPWSEANANSDFFRCLILILNVILGASEISSLYVYSVTNTTSDTRYWSCYSYNDDWKKESQPEEMVAELFGSLSSQPKALICTLMKSTSIVPMASMKLWLNFLFKMLKYSKLPFYMLHILAHGKSGRHCIERHQELNWKKLETLWNERWTKGIFHKEREINTEVRNTFKP